MLFSDMCTAAVVMGLLGLFIGIGIAMTPLSVIDSSVATIFVCFAEVSHKGFYIEMTSNCNRFLPGSRRIHALAPRFVPVACC